MTLADIIVAPYPLRKQARHAMLLSLSQEQKINCMKSKTYDARLTWLAEYMLDPDKVICCGIEGSNLLEECTKRQELLKGMALAKKRLSSVDAQLEKVKMRRTEINEDIGAKSNEVTLLDAKFANAGIDCETEENMSAIECGKESIRRTFEAMLRRIEEP